MLLNKISKIVDPKLLKIWGLHLLILYPICSFLEDNLETHTLDFKSHIDPEFWKTSLFSPINALWGYWEKFPFFIFMAFAISILLGFFLKRGKFFINYGVSLIISYLIVYLTHSYKVHIFYYIIPSLIITLIFQTIIFRKEIFSSQSTKNYKS